MPDILKLLRRLGFDASADFPRPLGGGLSHQIWAAAAAEGTFVVKRLNPVVMKRPAAPGNFRRSELLARTLAGRNSGDNGPPVPQRRPDPL
ncbi:MAG: hypothetical protein V8T86_10915 [Victivallis sp.]